VIRHFRYETNPTTEPEWAATEWVATEWAATVSEEPEWAATAWAATVWVATVWKAMVATLGQTRLLGVTQTPHKEGTIIFISCGCRMAYG
jgi:hypothetical protein